MLDHPETNNRAGYDKLFLKRPQWEFQRHGKCGTEVSTLFPTSPAAWTISRLIRSMNTSHSNHYNATLGMHTGSFTFARPEHRLVGELWAGDVNRNLPSFVVIAPQMPYAGNQVLGERFSAGRASGTLVVSRDRAGGKYPPPQPKRSAARKSSWRR